MKRKMQRFDDGGDVEMEDVGTPDIAAPEDKVSPDDLTFKEAFRMAVDDGKSSFTWRGKKYSTEMAKEKPSKSEASKDEDSGTSGGPRSRTSPRMQSVEITAKREKKESPGRRYTGEYGETREALSNLTPEQKARALKMGAGVAAMALGGPELAGAKAARGAFSARGFTLAERERAAAAAEQAAQKIKAFKDTAEARMRMGRGSVYKKGGSVKRYASGGSVSSASKRADGIAQRGKTKGRMC